LVDITKLEVSFHDLEIFRLVVGTNDKNLQVLNTIYHVQILTKGQEIFVDTFDKNLIKHLEKIFTVLIKIAGSNTIIKERDMIYISKLAEGKPIEEIVDIYLDKVFITKTLYQSN
jgi:phosphate starvation-inducible PhoH-like protein